MEQLPAWPLLATVSLMRILLAVAILVIALPWLIFPDPIERESSPWVTRALWLAFTATVAVHLLVVTKMYEAFVFLLLCLAVAAWRRIWGLSWVDRHRSVSGGLAWLFDRLDGKKANAARAPALALAPVPSARTSRSVKLWRWTGWLTLTGVIGVAAWVLFATAFATWAPPFSDAPVNLAWLKYIENGDLYHWNNAEVYPRGMYVALSLLAKLSALNGVLILDVVGPLIGLTILLSLLFFIYRTTRSLGAVIITGVLYGTLPQLITYTYERHAAPNSQEYGLIFVLPAAWFTFTYLYNGRSADRTTAAAAAGVAAFTHPVPTMFAIVAMAGTGLVALMGRPRAAWKRLPSFILWVGGAGAIALVPPVAALALGQKWHGSSVEYLQAAVTASPPINWWYLAIVIAAALIIPVTLLFARKRPNSDTALSLGAGAAVVALALFLSQLPSLGVRSQALEDRIEAIGAIGLAVGAGLAWSLLERLLGRWREAGVLPAAIVAAVSWSLLIPAPVRPYRYYADEMIQAYLQADSTYQAGTWTLVTNATTGYALAIGRCLHLTPDEFITFAERMPPDVTGWFDTDSRSATQQVTQHYVLMVEKQIPLAPGQPETAAEPRLAESARLTLWLDAHQATLPLHRLSSDAVLDVWTLEVPFPVDRFGFTVAPLQPGSTPAGR